MENTYTHTIYMRSNATHGTDEQKTFVHPGQIPREEGKRIAEGYGATLLAVKPTKIEPPALQHDTMMLQRFNSPVHAGGRLERRLFANLLNYLLANGFSPVMLNDGEDDNKVSDIQSTMELAFNLDECWVYFDYNGSGKAQHWIRITLGEGLDIINDYGCPKQDHDGWNAVMDVFDPQEYA